MFWVRWGQVRANLNGSQPRYVGFWAGTHPLCQKIRPMKRLWKQLCQTPSGQCRPFLSFSPHAKLQTINHTVARFGIQFAYMVKSQLSSFEDLIVWEILGFSSAASQASIHTDIHALLFSLNYCRMNHHSSLHTGVCIYWCEAERANAGGATWETVPRLCPQDKVETFWTSCGMRCLVEPK